MKAKRLVKCPRCSRSFNPTRDSPARPFCSERCKAIDLGHWFQESYRVPLSSSLREEEASEMDIDVERPTEADTDAEGEDEEQ